MSLSHEARIELQPAHVRYRAWWMVPLSYHTLAPLVAVFDFAWIIVLSVATGVAYHSVALGGSAEVAEFVGSGLAIAILFSATAHARGFYRASKLLGARSKVSEALLIWIMIFTCFASVAFTLKISDLFSRGALLLFFGSGLPTLLASRIGLSYFLRCVVSSGLLSSRRVVLLTASDQPLDTEFVRSMERYGCTLSRVFAVGDRGEKGFHSGLMERLSDVVRYVRQRRMDEILLAIDWNRTELIQRIVNELRVVPIPTRLIVDSSLNWLLERPLLEIGPANAVELQRAPLSPAQRALKRIIDIMASGLGLVVLMPLFGLMALAIILDSGGPVLFQQSRAGFNGRAFRIYKFRTMTTLENGPAVRQARKNDERVTRVGRFLRRFSLDELPQLINVMRGEMSLVGPRPHALTHDDEYSKLIAEYATRQKMKPGITGWAQVNGCRGETPHVEAMQRRVDHDLWYINCWSVWLDLRILAMTVAHLLRARDVY
jgi:Undecaprenyl-phosphate glucose phosphotransferase